MKKKSTYCLPRPIPRPPTTPIKGQKGFCHLKFYWFKTTCEKALDGPGMSLVTLLSQRKKVCLSVVLQLLLRTKMKLLKSLNISTAIATDWNTGHLPVQKLDLVSSWHYYSTERWLPLPPECASAWACSKYSLYLSRKVIDCIVTTWVGFTPSHKLYNLLPHLARLNFGQQWPEQHLIQRL